jgi:hypothetical protein
MPRTVVEILDSSLNKIAEVRSLAPLNKSGMVLRYSKEMSDYGYCTFRISTRDPFFTTYGDIVEPHKYHIRIKRGGVLVWHGAIIDNPSRNKQFVEVKGAEYEYYLDHVLIKRTSAVGYGEVAPSTDIGLHYRIFSSGTMASAVSTLITEAVAAIGSSHPLNTMTAGTITNPNYPENFQTSAGVALTGAWNFTSDIVLQFDYQSVLYALKQFGIYASCDFRLNDDLTFDFEPFLGNKHPELVFAYGVHGNIVDYNAPRLGAKLINDLYGIATSPDGTVLHTEKTDEPSKKEFGLMQAGVAFSDVKDQNALSARLAEELFLTSTLTASPLTLTLNEEGYPLGQWGVGDLITSKIVDGAINDTVVKRIVGFTVSLHNTGREVINVQLNNPKQKDLVTS